MGNQKSLQHWGCLPDVSGRPSNAWDAPRGQRDAWKQLAEKYVDEVKNAPVQHTSLEDVRRIVLGCDTNKVSFGGVPVVRPFISSTFTDTAMERDLLIRDVYPYLRAFARSLGVEFKQPAEMRWGIRKESSDAHQTSEICMTEIRSCLEESDGLAYILLLGDKYGYRPFPTHISRDHFRQLLTALENTNQKDAANLAKSWFLLDDNHVPPRYTLKPCGDVSPDDWWDIFETLRTAFRSVCNVLDAPEEKDKPLGLGGPSDYFWMSVTHQECVEGLLRLSPEERKKRCLVIRREFSDLHKIRVDDPIGRAFIDSKTNETTGKAAVDEEAQQLLKDLKQLVESEMDESRIFDFQTEWGPSITEETHESYLQDFSDLVTKMLMDNIRDVAIENRHESNDFLTEVMAHHRFGNVRMASFYASPSVASVRTKAEEYLVRPRGEEPDKPFIIYGRSGCGKTTVMASIIEAARRHHPLKENLATAESIEAIGGPVIISRFLGTTATSQRVVPLLRSMCNQLQQAYPHPSDETRPTPGTRGAWTELFSSLLKRATEDRPVWVFIDSIDQLHEERANSMNWFPLRVSKYCKIVVSVMEADESPLALLQSSLPDEVFTPVRAMDLSDARDMLDGWLRTSSRKLQPMQRSQLMLGFEAEPTTLYLKIESEMARHWSSVFSPPPDLSHAKTRDLIYMLFDGLESVHGEPITSHGLSYLMAARNGLSDMEMEDVLSCDDYVLDDVFEWWTPPIRRLPPLLWKRVRSDAACYLISHASEGMECVQLYHRQFWDAVECRYLSGTKRKEYHAALADYFSGRWVDQEKPYNDGKDVADRQLPPQPIVLHGSLGDSTCVLNVRVLDELVHAQIGAERWENLRSSLGNLEFMWAKCRAEQVQDLFCDYTTIEEAHAGTSNPHLQEIIDMGDFFAAYFPVFANRPWLIIQHALNSPDNSPSYKEGLRCVEIYKDQIGGYFTCGNKSQQKNPLQMTFTGHHRAVCRAPFSPDESMIATGSYDKSVHFYHAKSGRHAGTTVIENSVDCIAWHPGGDTLYAVAREKMVFAIDPQTFAFRKVMELPDNATWIEMMPSGDMLIAGLNNGSVVVVATNKMKIVRTVQAHEKRINKVRTCDNASLAVTSSEDEYCKLYRLKSEGKDGFDLVAEWKDHQYNCYDACLSADGKWVASVGVRGTVCVYGTMSHECVWRSNAGSGLISVAFSPDASLLTFAGGGARALFVHRTSDWKLVSMLRGHADNVVNVEFSPGGTQIISCGSEYDHAVCVWDVDLALKYGVPDGHKAVATHAEFTPDDTKVISTGSDCSRVYDARGMEVLGEVEPANDGSVHPSGRWMAIGGDEKILYVYEIDTLRLVGSYDSSVSTHSQKICGVKYSGDGQFLITEDKKCQGVVWRVNQDDGTLSVEKPLDLTGPFGPAKVSTSFSPDGKLCALSMRNGLFTGIFDTETWEMVCQCLLCMSGFETVWTPDGQYFIISLSNGNLKRYKVSDFVKTDEKLGDGERFPLHSRAVLSLDIRHDGRYLATGSDDKTVRILNTQTMEQVAYFIAGSSIQSVRFSHDDSHLIVVDLGGLVYKLRICNLSEAPKQVSRRRSVMF